VLSLLEAKEQSPRLRFGGRRLMRLARSTGARAVVEVASRMP
jgi:hypothetical protein